MSLEFMGNYFGEAEIIGYAYDYEQATQFRRASRLTTPEPTIVSTLLLASAIALSLKLKSQNAKR